MHERAGGEERGRDTMRHEEMNEKKLPTLWLCMGVQWNGCRNGDGGGVGCTQRKAGGNMTMVAVMMMRTSG